MNKQDNKKDNSYIKKVIESNSQFFIGRIAGCELDAAYLYQKGNRNNDLKELENNAGIHVSDGNSLAEYTFKLIQSYEHCISIRHFLFPSGEWIQHRIHRRSRRLCI